MFLNEVELFWLESVFEKLCQDDICRTIVLLSAYPSKYMKNKYDVMDIKL